MSGLELPTCFSSNPTKSAALTRVRERKQPGVQEPQVGSPQRCERFLTLLPAPARREAGGGGAGGAGSSHPRPQELAGWQGGARRAAGAAGLVLRPPGVPAGVPAAQAAFPQPGLSPSFGDQQQASRKHLTAAEKGPGAPGGVSRPSSGWHGEARPLPSRKPQCEWACGPWSWARAVGTVAGVGSGPQLQQGRHQLLEPGWLLHTEQRPQNDRKTTQPPALRKHPALRPTPGDPAPMAPRHGAYKTPAQGEGRSGVSLGARGGGC